jgi:hypothetical protein
MGTTSRIGLQNEDGTFTVVYCHFDGRLFGVGRILFKYYTDLRKIKTLLHYGDLSELGPEIESCRFYCRDFGESYTAVKSFKLKNLEEWATRYWFDYNYFFRDGIWWMFKGENLEKLSTVEIELAFEYSKYKSFK